MMGANERQDGAASMVHATPARLPCIEGFFCKILPDTNLLSQKIQDTSMPKSVTSDCLSQSRFFLSSSISRDPGDLRKGDAYSSLLC
jgi:hypothetical protein